MFRGNVDVVVCDGFIGNIALKLSEGSGRAHRRNVEEERSRAACDRKSATRFPRSAFDEFRKRTDYSETGGAPLLGVRGITVIGHGRSNPNAIKNAIRVAAELCRARVNEKIEQELSSPLLPPQSPPAAEPEGTRNRHEQACISFSRTGLAISRHGQGPRREFSRIARRV